MIVLHTGEGHVKTDQREIRRYYTAGLEDGGKSHELKKRKRKKEKDAALEAGKGRK